MRRPRSVSDFGILSHDRVDLNGYDGGNWSSKNGFDYNYFGGNEVDFDDVMNEGNQEPQPRQVRRPRKKQQKYNPFSAEAISRSGGKSTLNPNQELF